MTARDKWLRSLPLIVGSAVVVIVAIALIFFVRSMLLAPAPKPTVQQISLLVPPPPPKVDTPPPPPEIKEEVKLEEKQVEPEPTPDTPSDEPPPGDLLGLDADGGAGADGFGLIGKKGGRGLIGSGEGSRFAWYAGTLKEQLSEHLSDRDEVRKKRYSVRVLMWINADATIKRVQVVDSTGNKSVDNALRGALDKVTRVAEAPPEDMPQPVRLRISSRM